MDLFTEIWSQVKTEYENGLVVSERNLQAVLFGKIRKAMPSTFVIAEPTWKLDGKRRSPDLVIVRNNFITDIFELKFMTSYDAWRKDVKKLIDYVETNNRYPVFLNPYTGDYAEKNRIHNRCRLHFVIVADCKAEGVQELTLQDYLRDSFPKHANKFHHWIGRNHSQNWEIVPITTNEP